jgi:hypothetical protein
MSTPQEGTALRILCAPLTADERALVGKDVGASVPSLALLLGALKTTKVWALDRANILTW